MSYKIMHGKKLTISLIVSILSFVVILTVIYFLGKIGIEDAILGMIFFGCITGWYFQTIYSLFEKERGEET
jgi:hypothetical protein